SPEHDTVAFKIFLLFRCRESQIMSFAHVDFFREQSWHPPRRERRGEDETERSAHAVGSQHTPFRQRRDDAPRMTLGRAHRTRGVAARKFSAIKHGFENVAGFWRQRAQPDFFFRPEAYTRAQFRLLPKPLHELDRVHAN